MISPETFGLIALLISEHSKCTKLKVGAVVIWNNRIVGTGYNGTPHGFENDCEGIDERTHSHVIHAEENAIITASRVGVNLNECEMIVTEAPCQHCAAIISMYQLKRVYYVFNTRYDKGIEILRNSGVQVVPTYDLLDAWRSIQSTLRQDRD